VTTATTAASRGSFTHEVGVLAERDFRRSFSRSALVQTVVQPLLFFGIFYLTFSRMLATKGVDYGRWVTPALIVQALMFIAIASSMTVATERSSGLFNRLRATLSHGAALGVARGLTVAAEALVSTVLIAAVAHLAGFRFDAGPLAALAFVVIAVLFAFALAAVTATLGLTIRSQEALGAALYLPYLPLLVVSTGFVPAELFPEWLRPVVHASPVSAAVDALRVLSTGLPGGDGFGAVWPAIAWSVGLTLLFGWTTARAFRKVQA
jgi:ABC-2 type transport system permease protein